jgi:hypothetical protein
MRRLIVASLVAAVVALGIAGSASADGTGFVGGVCQGTLRAGTVTDVISADFSLECVNPPTSGAVKFCLERWYSSLGVWKDIKCVVRYADGRTFGWYSQIVCHDIRVSPATWRGYAYASVVPGAVVRVYSESRRTDGDKIPGVDC